MKKITGLNGEEKSLLVSLLEAGDPGVQTTIRDIRTIDKICTLIECSTDSLNLEDADYEYMKNRLSKFSAWVPKARKDIITLADKIGI